MCCSTVPKQIEIGWKWKISSVGLKNDQISTSLAINRNEPEDLNDVSFTYSSFPRSCLVRNISRINIIRLLTTVKLYEFLLITFHSMEYIILDKIKSSQWAFLSSYYLLRPLLSKYRRKIGIHNNFIVQWSMWAIAFPKCTFKRISGCMNIFLPRNKQKHITYYMYIFCLRHKTLTEEVFISIHIRNIHISARMRYGKFLSS